MGTKHLIEMELSLKQRLGVIEGGKISVLHLGDIYRITNEAKRFPQSSDN